MELQLESNQIDILFSLVSLISQWSARETMQIPVPVTGCRKSGEAIPVPDIPASMMHPHAMQSFLLRECTGRKGRYYEALCQKSSTTLVKVRWKFSDDAL